MNEMRAIRYNHYGSPDVLHEDTIPRPEAAAGEVLVRVHGTSVNGVDLDTRAGILRRVTNRRFPKGTGIDFTGEVAAVGAGVSGLGRGERVWGLLPDAQPGAAAEYVTVPAGKLAPAPASLDLIQSAALPAVGSTAITALRDQAGLRRGERLLVRGAAGGVGSMAVQLGHAWGAHVTGLAGSRSLDFVRELGAEHVLDYRSTPAGALGRFDVILDTVGTGLRAYRRLLAPGGRMVAIALDYRHLVASLGYVAVSAAFGSRRVRFFRGDPDTALMTELTRQVEAGNLRPIVAGVHQLAEVATAHRMLEAGGSVGKHVIQVV